MSPTRVAAVALLVVAAGCAGAPASDAQTTAPTTEPTRSSTDAPTTNPSTTAPHTAVGTSHTSTHFVVHDAADADVTVTLAPNGVDETYAVDGGTVDLTREVHEPGHEVRVVVERGDETVFDETVLGYEYYELTVSENDTDVRYTVV